MGKTGIYHRCSLMVNIGHKVNWWQCVNQMLREIVCYIAKIRVINFMKIQNPRHKKSFHCFMLVYKKNCFKSSFVLLHLRFSTTLSIYHGLVSVFIATDNWQLVYSHFVNRMYRSLNKIKLKILSRMQILSNQLVN